MTQSRQLAARRGEIIRIAGQTKPIKNGIKIIQTGRRAVDNAISQVKAAL